MDRPVWFRGPSDASAGRPSLRLVASDGEAVTPAVAPAPTKASRLALPPDASLDEAIARVLSACADHFEANAPALRVTGDPEAVHQLRVALRRLRAFLGLLRADVPCPELNATAAHAKGIAGLLGPARDWHVFREALDAGPREFLNGDPSFAALIEAVDQRRVEAQEAARAEIAAPSTQEFLRDLRSLVARRAWRESAEGSEETGSAQVFAARQLDRLHKRALKRCAGIETKTPEERHRARIALKKIRYAAEFFESLFDAKSAARAYLRRLAKIQDRLGEENDRAVAARLLQEIAQADPDQKMTRALGFLSGWRLQAQTQDAGVKKCEKRLRRLEPFWR